MPTDLRARELAKIAVNYCIEAKPKSKIIISGGYESIPFLTELYKEIILKECYPVVKASLPNINDFFYKYAKDHQINYFPEKWFEEIKECKGYIGIDTDENTRELTSADSKKITSRKKILKPISDYIVNSRPKMKRVTISYPCLSHAQEAEMSLVEWENFVYKACLIDWKKFSKTLDKINSYFKKGKQVYLKGENIDLKFQIHGEKSAVDDGRENMPGGEIFMAPVRESLNGHIKFDYPRIIDGKLLSGVYLKFKDGKVIEYDAEHGKEYLSEILKTDENSSYVGEFGIGMNPSITTYSNNLLFDEKISGTIHLALGMAYKENLPEGKKQDSAIHVDIVKNMKKAKIILDGKVVQDKGKWRI